MKRPTRQYQHVLRVLAIGLAMLWLVPLQAQASKQIDEDGLTVADVSHVRQQLAQAKTSLAQLAALGVPAKARAGLQARIRKAEEALVAYEKLASRVRPRKSRNGRVYTAGVAPSLASAGIASTLAEALVPMLAVGILAAHIITHLPPSSEALGTAWQELTTAMQDVGREAERIKRQAARSRAIPDRKNCRKHYELCHDTILGSRNSADWGTSICQACQEVCKRTKWWPDQLASEKPCQWWDWIGVAPPGDNTAKE